jgi:hypothetical protein
MLVSVMFVKRAEWIAQPVFIIPPVARKRSCKVPPRTPAAANGAGFGAHIPRFGSDFATLLKLRGSDFWQSRESCTLGVR